MQSDTNIPELKQHIIIDCPPGIPRPGDLLPFVLKDTGLEPREPSWTVFGEWGFNYSDVPETKWDEIQPIFEERIKNLYERSLIRYGSWS
jgi:hypothetical protein